jgi:peptidoglycan/LPS O-acetylase OafA/YrhL
MLNITQTIPSVEGRSVGTRAAVESDAPHTRHRALDGVRGLAVLAVMASHLTKLDASSLPTDQLLNWITRFGGLAVDLFFALSGFLITRILLGIRNTPGRAAHFYWRRARRILPLFIVTLLVTYGLVLPWSRVHAPVDAARLAHEGAWHALFGTNWLEALHGPEVVPYLGHLWSLSIEEQFYLVWPWVVWSVPERRLPTVCLTVLFVSPLLRGALLAGGIRWTFVYAATPLRLDALMVGSWLATIASTPGALSLLSQHARRLALESTLAILAVIFAIGSPPTSGRPLEQVASFSAVAILSGALVLHALTSSEQSIGGRFWRMQWLTKAGRLSYGLYLINVLLAECSERLGWTPIHARAAGGSHLLAQSAYWVVVGGLTWTLAAASWRWLEEPILSAGNARHSSGRATPHERLDESAA